MLLVAVIGLAFSYVGVDKNTAVIVSFIATIPPGPLTSILGFATEEISLYVGGSLRRLLSTSFKYVDPLSPRTPTNMTE